MSNRKPLVDINITPLVDVLLVLVAVLIISMPAMLKEMGVKLPKVSQGTPIQGNRAMKIIIAKDGQLKAGLYRQTPEQIAKAAKQFGAAEVYVDSGVPYEKVARVLSALQKEKVLDIKLMVN